MGMHLPGDRISSSSSSSVAPMRSNQISPSQNTLKTPFSNAPVPSNHISPNPNRSNPHFNCPHALKPHFAKSQHLKPPYQLPPCPQNTFHPVPTPQAPFSTAPMPAKHISPNHNTRKPLCNWPLPSNHISPSANTSMSLFNSPHALKLEVTPSKHSQTPFSLAPCSQVTFHLLPTPPTPILDAPMPSKHISPTANTSNTLFKSPHDLEHHFTHCQHLKRPFQKPPCPQTTFHPVPTPPTPISTAPMPAKHISLREEGA